MITNLFQTVIDTVNNLTHDYGLTIVLVTITINLLLLPLTIKQQKSMNSMKDLSDKANKIKEKYKNDEVKMNEELQKLYQTSTSSYSGCLIMFLQLPIFIVMYRLFTKNIVDTSTKLLPWVSSLTLPDPYFILPILYIIVQLLPNILAQFNILKSVNVAKLSIQTVAMPVVMSLLLVAKMPSAMGIYFITSAVIRSLQQLIK
ncbi:YidC/Oxa1 family membrane protein insertase [Clostridium sp. 'deep sea']|uniref:YidC/Oxa1 family membrane protein insertase n=1 Tax=Clostridium sp. 'deep sea' TaxID=2779445 RepID=UPI0018965B5B|nr:YidC/Oxa1 family membrane protein insertase [Clostridium sp. 'deep sea']QOR34857.1 YidC/Oxa1 family membrane protein insertase [Clostridium sp. 'deep sea']